jgi:hypothetical protein
VICIAAALFRALVHPARQPGWHVAVSSSPRVPWVCLALRSSAHRCFSAFICRFRARGAFWAQRCAALLHFVCTCHVCMTLGPPQWSGDPAYSPVTLMERLLGVSLSMHACTCVPRTLQTSDLHLPYLLHGARDAWASAVVGRPCL